VKIKKLPLASFEVCQIESFIALVSISAVRANKCKTVSRNAHLKVVRRAMKRLRSWVKENPNSCYGKLFLLEAEMAAMKGDHQLAYAKYSCALAMTKSENLLFEHAIQAERAGRCMQDNGEVELARGFFQESRETYVKWGAFGRAEFLHEEMDSKGTVPSSIIS
jgi:hypothetical protein